MKFKKYDKQWLSELCAESYSLAEVLQKAGRSLNGGTYDTLKKKIIEYNIDTSHFTGQLWSKGKTKAEDPRITTREKYNIEDIFIENSPYDRNLAKRYILRHNLIEYKCAICGNIGIWLDQPISLQLDHINGINNDHRLDNLRWLCPNCHSQTENFGSRNIHKAELTEQNILNAIEQGATSAREVCLFLQLSINGGNINKVKLLAYKLGYEL